MTPGLAGFIASGHDEQAWEQSVVGVLTALAAEFEVVPERGEPASAGRRTLLDTFDWRLHKAGLTLEYVARSVGGELRLADRAVSTTATADVAGNGSAPSAGSATGTGAAASTGGVDRPDAARPVITQPVTGWQAARPHPMGELPAGPVASRVGDLVVPRALLPVVTITTAVTTHRLLNEDGKTVARLRVERPALAGQRPGSHGTPLGSSMGGSRPPSPLAPRLLVAEVRGYLGAARRAERLVGAAPGIESAPVPVFTEALRAIGRRPGDYSNKVDTSITAAMPASQAAVFHARAAASCSPHVSPGTSRPYSAKVSGCGGPSAPVARTYEASPATIGFHRHTSASHSGAGAGYGCPAATKSRSSPVTRTASAAGSRTMPARAPTAASTACDNAQPSSRSGRSSSRTVSSGPGTGGVQPVSAPRTASSAHSVIGASTAFCAARICRSVHGSARHNGSHDGLRTLMTAPGSAVTAAPVVSTAVPSGIRTSSG